MLLFDEHQKKLSSKIAAKRIINHAEETNRKFWEVWYESPCSFDIDNLKLRCSEGPTFDSATDDAKKELKWCELTRCY